MKRIIVTCDICGEEKENGHEATEPTKECIAYLKSKIEKLTQNNGMEEFKKIADKYNEKINRQLNPHYQPPFYPDYLKEDWPKPYWGQTWC